MRADVERFISVPTFYFQQSNSFNYIVNKMVDSEDIIHSVKKFRAIWDLDNEGYHNKHLKDDAWNSVCSDLIADWNFLPEGEKYIRQLELKKKWNNIRDYYKKLLSEQRPGEEVRAKKRRYLYSDILEFIRPVYDKKRYELESNDSAQSDTQEDVETVTFMGVPTSKMGQQLPANTLIKPVSQLQRVTRPAQKNKRRFTQMTAFERSVIKRLEKSTTQDEDPDLLFLKSLLPDMQKLTSSQKIDFKLGIMELYKNISNAGDQDHEFDHLAEVEVHNVKVETVRLTDNDNTYLSS